ncbi:bifunctional glutamine synthetase adenylyltransferase/deadenyltransferase, partial [Salmonella enterica subsp. enterica]|nr:bifunctional glutamine synthetase adenylyltransferase/deadenyltransferase [Salmonella enterica subsp. enterica]
MNAAQLQKTLRASQYTEQVLANHQSLLEQDYAIDQFQGSLSREYIDQLVQHCILNISDEATWMRAMRILRARLMFRWIWQDANQLTDVITLTQELSDFADACICA